MSFINYLIVGGAFGFLLLLWAIVGVRHLRFLNGEVLQRREKVFLLLRRRQDLVPNLIETLRQHDQSRNELVQSLIDARAMAIKEGMDGRFENERALKVLIDKVLILDGAVAGLGRDTNFLELKREISELAGSIEITMLEYDKKLERFNRHRRMILLRPLAAVMR